MRALILLALTTLAFAGTPSQWKDKVIYQTLTDRFAVSGAQSGCSNLSGYCGGNYQGMIAQLDYIAGLGVSSVWISPVVMNYEGGYHGYWMMDLNKVNEHFGSESDLHALIEAAHQRGLWVMTDVVANHVGPVDLDFSQVVPFNDPSHYHSKCQITDFNNQQQVELCRLANLPDLDQNNAFVKDTLYNYIENLVKTYKFDGIRVDTVPEVHIDFWDNYNKAAGVFCIGEVFNGNMDYVANYQHHLDGLLNYPLFFAMRNAFTSSSSNMQQQFEYLLGPTGQMWSKFKDIELMATFIDNHDNPRFLKERYDIPAYKNALAMTLLTTGIPILYYGGEQEFAGGADPANRETLWPHYNTNSELYTFIATVLKHRKAHSLSSAPQVQRYAAANIYAFSRGDTVVCLTNLGQNGRLEFDLTYLPAGWKPGAVVCDVLNPSDCATVTNGKVHVTYVNGQPKIYALKTSLLQ